MPGARAATIAAQEAAARDDDTVGGGWQSYEGPSGLSSGEIPPGAAIPLDGPVFDGLDDWVPPRRMDAVGGDSLFVPADSNYTDRVDTGRSGNREQGFDSLGDDQLGAIYERHKQQLFALKTEVFDVAIVLQRGELAGEALDDARAKIQDPNSALYKGASEAVHNSLEHLLHVQQLVGSINDVLVEFDEIVRIGEARGLIPDSEKNTIKALREVINLAEEIAKSTENELYVTSAQTQVEFQLYHRVSRMKGLATDLASAHGKYSNGTSGRDDVSKAYKDLQIEHARMAKILRKIRDQKIPIKREQKQGYEEALIHYKTVVDIIDPQIKAEVDAALSQKTDRALLDGDQTIGWLSQIDVWDPPPRKKPVPTGLWAALVTVVAGLGIGIATLLPWSKPSNPDPDPSVPTDSPTPRPRDPVTPPPVDTTPEVTPTPRIRFTPITMATRGEDALSIEVNRAGDVVLVHSNRVHTRAIRVRIPEGDLGSTRTANIAAGIAVEVADDGTITFTNPSGNGEPLRLKFEGNLDRVKRFLPDGSNIRTDRGFDLGSDGIFSGPDDWRRFDRSYRDRVGSSGQAVTPVPSPRHRVPTGATEVSLAGGDHRIEISASGRVTRNGQALDPTDHIFLTDDNAVGVGHTVTENGRRVGYTGDLLAIDASLEIRDVYVGEGRRSVGSDDQGRMFFVLRTQNNTELRVTIAGQNEANVGVDSLWLRHGVNVRSFADGQVDVDGRSRVDLGKAEVWDFALTESEAIRLRKRAVREVERAEAATGATATQHATEARRLAERSMAVFEELQGLQESSGLVARPAVRNHAERAEARANAVINDQQKSGAGKKKHTDKVREDKGSSQRDR